MEKWRRRCDAAPLAMIGRKNGIIAEECLDPWPDSVPIGLY
jgi:hypothetical protein